MTILPQRLSIKSPRIWGKGHGQDLRVSGEVSSFGEGRVKTFFIALFSIGMVLSSAAFAHSPYVVKVKTLESPSGEPLILEKLFGDGIFVADPVSLQVRNMNGAVLAYTPTSTHIGVFCPSLKFCWAFPHDIVTIFSTPWLLDYKNLDYEKKPASVTGEKDTQYAAQYRDYLTNRKTSAFHSEWKSGYEFVDPFGRESSLGFTKSSPLFSIISPIFIFVDHAVPLVVFSLISLLPFVIKFRCSRLAFGRKDAVKLLLNMFVLLIYMAWFCLFILFIFIICFTLSIPVFYSFLTFMAALWGWYRYIASRKVRV